MNWKCFSLHFSLLCHRLIHARREQQERTNTDANINRRHTSANTNISFFLSRVTRYQKCTFIRTPRVSIRQFFCPEQHWRLNLNWMINFVRLCWWPMGIKPRPPAQVPFLVGFRGNWISTERKAFSTRTHTRHRLKCSLSSRFFRWMENQHFGKIFFVVARFIVCDNDENSESADSFRSNVRGERRCAGSRMNYIKIISRFSAFHVHTYQ